MRHLLIVSVLLLVSCSKDDNPIIPEIDAFSWTYNGRTYNLIRKNNIANAGAFRGINGQAAILFDMSDSLGGGIYFEKACAYLEPTGDVILNNEGCVLTEKDGTGNIVPIDSTKVYIYQS
ncbi:MAG: hypothetical protein WBN39_06510, partial [Flavobacteriaceae bacterium]